MKDFDERLKRNEEANWAKDEKFISHFLGHSDYAQRFCSRWKPESERNQVRELVALAGFWAVVAGWEQGHQGYQDRRLATVTFTKDRAKDYGKALRKCREAVDQLNEYFFAYDSVLVSRTSDLLRALPQVLLRLERTIQTQPETSFVGDVERGVKRLAVRHDVYLNEWVRLKHGIRASVSDAMLDLVGSFFSDPESHLSYGPVATKKRIKRYWQESRSVTADRLPSRGEFLRWTGIDYDDVRKAIPDDPDIRKRLALPDLPSSHIYPADPSRGLETIYRNAKNEIVLGDVTDPDFPL